MFSKTSVAVLAGMALAGSVLVAPGVVAAPTSGRAAAWGLNNFGQLGINSTTDSSVPVPVDTAGVLAGKTVTAISAGAFHSCAVAEGRAYCWGTNGNGGLGINSTTDSSVPVPVDTAGVLAGKTVTAISAGSFYSCAVAEGRAYCWGYNGDGELGNNSTTSTSVPVAVNTSGPLNGKTVTAISTGSHHSCAVADGRAFCWGYNGDGELGNNSTTNATVPVAVNTSGPLNGRTVTAISAGYGHTCAVADGRAFCWGYNADGELGNNSTTNATVPVAVNTAGPLNGRTVSEITAGSNHTCVVAAGGAYCWGYNNYGQLGNNSTTKASVPVAVNTAGPLNGKTVTAITTGGFHSCLVAEGRASCWGYNNYGQLGETRHEPSPLTTRPAHGALVRDLDRDRRGDRGVHLHHRGETPR